jgi:regulator of sigma E protease
MGVVIRILTRTGETETMTMELKSPGKPLPEKHKLDLASWQMDNLKPDPLESIGIEPYIPAGDKWPEAYLRKNQYGPMGALKHAWQNVSDFTTLNFLMIGKLLTGKVSIKSLGGPLSIFETAGAALNNGITPFLSFLAFLSIAIGVINILPIPGLDGGHLIFQIAEVIMRRPVPARVVELCYRLGFIMLILLITQSIVNDILRL